MNGASTARTVGKSASQQGTAARPAASAGGGIRAPRNGATPQGSSAGQTSRVAALRERREASIQPASAGRGARRRQAAHRPWWQGSFPILATLGVVALIVVLFVVAANNGGTTSSLLLKPVSANVASEVTSVSPSVLAAVGAGGLKAPLKSISGAAPLQGANGKAEVLYIGGEFCPYCAADRWSMVIALSRFGTVSNLEYMQSSATDVYPSTDTFSFRNIKYTSSTVDLVSVEAEDRAQNQLQSLSSQQQQLLTTYGGNSFPFVDVGNNYVNVSSGFSPQVLTDLSWDEIAGKLKDANDPVTQGIVGEANYLTAAICQQTNNQPGSVCTAAPIPQIQQQLPK